MYDYASLFSPSVPLSYFILLSLFPSLSRSFSMFSEGTRCRDVGGGKMETRLGEDEEGKMRRGRKWDDRWVTGEMVEGLEGEVDRWKEKKGPFLAYINVWILKVLLMMCDCVWAAQHPQPLLLLLANHHTTLLYLGHSNVLLLSPLADALCCNLQKIGWEEEKSMESGRREGVVTEARSFPPYKNWTSSFVNLFQYDFQDGRRGREGKTYLSLLPFLSSYYLSFHPHFTLWAIKGFYVLQ